MYPQNEINQYTTWVNHGQIARMMMKHTKEKGKKPEIGEERETSQDAQFDETQFKSLQVERLTNY